MLLEQHVRAGALYQGRQALRALRRGDVDAFDRIQGRMVDTIESSRHPSIMVVNLAAGFRFKEALDLGFELPLVRFAHAGK